MVSAFLISAQAVHYSPPHLPSSSLKWCLSRTGKQEAVLYWPNCVALSGLRGLLGVKCQTTVSSILISSAFFGANGTLIALLEPVGFCCCSSYSLSSFYFLFFLRCYKSVPFDGCRVISWVSVIASSDFLFRQLQAWLFLVPESYTKGRFSFSVSYSDRNWKYKKSAFSSTHKKETQHQYQIRPCGPCGMLTDRPILNITSGWEISTEKASDEVSIETGWVE